MQIFKPQGLSLWFSDILVTKHKL